MRSAGTDAAVLPRTAARIEFALVGFTPPLVATAGTKNGFPLRAARFLPAENFDFATAAAKRAAAQTRRTVKASLLPSAELFG